jgi:hypothetical protein
MVALEGATPLASPAFFTAPASPASPATTTTTTTTTIAADMFQPKALAEAWWF